MGYSITIGEATIIHPGDDDYSSELRIGVTGLSLPEAPEFPGDGMTSKGNGRSPSCSGWENFCRDVGLYDLFFRKEDEEGPIGLMTSHPGTFGLTAKHAAEIRAALDRRRSADPDGLRVPGWDPTLEGSAAWTQDGADPKYDGNLARLIWLDWWVSWAVANCKTPTIQNT